MNAGEAAKDVRDAEDAPGIRERLRRLFLWPSVQLRLDLDTRCNLRCEFCSTGHAGNVDRGPFPDDRFDAIASGLGKDVWSVFLSCAGEPLLDPGFERAMESVRRNLSHRDVQLVSNATLLSEAKARAHGGDGFQHPIDDGI